jgi:crotonobetainyl-CoA:carnitine CoA-transferase CaiB-like acyl-CoA transferase
MSALSGVKVICVGQFYFAPYCSMLLARLGADVIKIEAPDGDPYRRLAKRRTPTERRFSSRC